MRTWVWDTVFVVGAVFGALIAARYYVVGVLAKDRLLAGSAATIFFLFTAAAVLYSWWFW
jgi:hypothetical protein